MAIGYTGVGWQNYPSTATPTDATNFNKMDKGIKDAHEALALHETDIVDLKANAITGEKVLTTKAAVLANETAGKVVDALVLKPITEHAEASIQIVSFNATTGALITKSTDYVG